MTVRPTRDLRIILTPDGFCNYSCCYCHGEGFSSPGRTISIAPDVIAEAANTLLSSCISGVTISGGEPLLAIDYIHKLTSQLKEAPITILTNGSLLGRIGVSILLTQRNNLRIIVNLPSFQDKTYRALTGQRSYSVSGIANSIRSISKTCSVHLNCVLIKNINAKRSDVLAYCSAAKSLGIESVRFIVQPADSAEMSLLVKRLGLSTDILRGFSGRSIEVDILPDQMAKIIICGATKGTNGNNDLYVTTDGRIRYGFSGKISTFADSQTIIEYARRLLR